jgi:hypothetical protein
MHVLKEHNLDIVGRKGGEEGLGREDIELGKL